MDLLRKEDNILMLHNNTLELNKIPADFKNVTHEKATNLNNHAQARFDAIIVTAVTDNIDNIISKIYESVKPGGLFSICSCSETDISKLEFLLKTNGFIKVAVCKSNPLLIEIIGYKPTYEIGSSTKLNLSKPTSSTAAVWKLDDDVDEDVEIIDPDDLLDEDDFKKPDQSSLKVCGTTGKRKACKDCSCGLAEELDAEHTAQKPVNSAEAKSSCGSCYLGDAFRCATCPYLGMPAFKPGEKVQLTDNLLKADV